MKTLVYTTISFLTSFILIQCHSSENKASSASAQKELQETTTNLIHDISPVNDEGLVNAVIEIPAGTADKWEVSKTNGTLEWEKVDNKHRVVDYLGYPGNYGMIPQTLLDKEQGGDGDPLDILVLGPPVERGTLLPCKIIGMLQLTDRGEQDDKLIGISNNSSMSHINSIEQLDQEYNGISEIIQLWFTNYKGPDKMKSIGYADQKVAQGVLSSAMESYQNSHRQ